MNTLIYYGLSLCLTTNISVQSNIEQLRKNYLGATQEESICKQEIERINSFTSESAIEMAYHGAYHMLWAKYLSAPLSKLNSFKKGKELMDSALKKRYGDSEIHFLRLTIQQHAPGILKYNKNIQEDIHQITQHWESVPSTQLKKQMKEFFVSNQLLDETHLKKLKI